MAPFFSVIVPEHNAAAYMRKGLDSIKEQTFTDYELIIICDSCTDNTEQIAKEYTNKVIKINRGMSGASWNTGLEYATGKWILFMDDDDWFLHDYVFEMLAEKLKTLSNIDVLAFSFIFRTRGYAKCSLWAAIWNKVYKNDFLQRNHIRFPFINFASDVEFSDKVAKLGRISYWDMPLYYYNYMREGSLTYRAAQGEELNS